MILQHSRSKYHAKPTIVDNIRFDSQKEARRYGELKLLLKAGEIEDLVVQPAFSLLAAAPFLMQDGRPERAIEIGTYRADFRYFDRVIKRMIVEDVKSPATRTALYRLKKKLAEACHGITIREV